MTKTKETPMPLLGPPDQDARTIIDLANQPNINHDDQRLIRRWLDVLVQKLRDQPPASAAARRRVLNEIKGAFSEIELRGITKTATVKNGTIRINFNFQLVADTGHAKLGKLFANVLNEGYDKFIRFCPECGQFFFDKPSARPIKWFCTPAHNNAYRQREYRERTK